MGLGLGFGFGLGLEGDHGGAEAGEVGVLGEVFVEAYAVEELHLRDTSGDIGRCRGYGEMCGDVGSCGEMWGRYGEIAGDTKVDMGEIQGDAGRYGEMQGRCRGRCCTPRTV